MTIKLGFHVPLTSKADKSNELASFLTGALDLVEAEPETIQWYALKFDEVNTFAIFDTFHDQAGCEAHAKGKVAAALFAKAPELLSETPQIAPVEVLASKVKAKQAHDKTAGLAAGLRTKFSAKPDHVTAVKNILTAAQVPIYLSGDTPVWYGLHFPDTNHFVVIDFFHTKEGRDAHLNGKVGPALFNIAEVFLEGPPTVEKFDVLAAKV